MARVRFRWKDRVKCTPHSNYWALWKRCQEIVILFYGSMRERDSLIARIYLIFGAKLGRHIWLQFWFELSRVKTTSWALVLIDKQAKHFPSRPASRLASCANHKFQVAERSGFVAISNSPGSKTWKNFIYSLDQLRLRRLNSRYKVKQCRLTGVCLGASWEVNAFTSSWSIFFHFNCRDTERLWFKCRCWRYRTM